MGARAQGGRAGTLCACGARGCDGRRVRLRLSVLGSHTKVVPDEWGNMPSFLPDEEQFVKGDPVVVKEGKFKGQSAKHPALRATHTHTSGPTGCPPLPNPRAPLARMASVQTSRRWW